MTEELITNLEELEDEIELQEEEEIDLQKCELMFEQKTGVKFNNYYAKFYPKLVWYLRSKCTDHFEVEDIAVDSFVKALQNIHKFDPTYQFSTWLYKLSYNVLKEHFKKKARINIVKDLEDSVLVELCPNIESTIVEDDYRNTLKVDVVIDCMQSLTDKKNKVLELREFDELSYQEISDKLNLNLSTVKSQIKGGRADLTKLVRNKFNYIHDAY